MTIFELKNLALRRIGQSPLEEGDTESRAALALEAWWETARKEVMSSFPWSCLIMRASCLESEEENLTGFARLYDLPVDCLRVLDIQGERGLLFRLEGGLLATDEGEEEDGAYSLFIRYLADITEEEGELAWDWILIQAVITRLAYYLAAQLTGDKTREEALLRDYAQSLNTALSVKALESREDVSAFLGLILGPEHVKSGGSQPLA